MWSRYFVGPGITIESTTDNPGHHERPDGFAVKLAPWPSWERPSAQPTRRADRATLLCFVKQLRPRFRVGGRGLGRRSEQGNVWSLGWSFPRQCDV